MKNTVLKGTIILIASSLIAKILGAIYRVPLVGLIGTNGIGLFQLIFPIYALFLVIASTGLTTAVAKIVSINVNENKCQYVKQFMRLSLIFSFFVGLFFSVLLTLLAPLIANIQGYFDARVCYYVIAPSILFVCIISTIKGYFQGLQNMLPSAISQVVEQLAKLIFALLLSKIMIKNGMIYGVCGSLLGVTISEVCCVLFLLITYLVKKKNFYISVVNENEYQYSKKDMIKLLIRESVSIMLGGMILPMVSAIESVLIVYLLSKASIGKDVALRIYGLEDGMVGSLINMPIVVAVAISTALLPNLTADFNKNNFELVKSKCEIAIKYVLLISMPCALIYLAFADKIIYFLYANGLNFSKLDQFLIATNLLKFSSINIVYLSLLNTLTMILQAINKNFIPVRNLIIASSIKLILNFVIVTNPAFNIYGIVITDIICYSASCLMNILSIKKVIDIKLQLSKCFVFPIIALGVTFATMKICDILLINILGSRVILIISTMVGMTAYFLVLLATKVFTKQELSMLPKIRPKKTKMIL